jgi:hypothetical protein
MIPHVICPLILLLRSTLLGQAPAPTLLCNCLYKMKTETEIEQEIADAARHFNAQRQGLLRMPNELLCDVARILSNTKDTSAIAHLYRTCSLLQSIVGEEAYQKLVWEYRGSGDRKDRDRFGKLVKSLRVLSVESVSLFLSIPVL